jgi:hypothetical protein
MTFIFDDLREEGCHAVPVTGLGRTSRYQEAVRATVARDQHGLCLRIGLAEAARPEAPRAVAAVLENAGVEAADCDLVLDLGAPNFQPVDGFSRAIEAVLRGFPKLCGGRTFTLLGTSFPATMAEVRESPTRVPRLEWTLYKSLIGRLSAASLRLPAFGDYGINHPDLLTVDMRLVKPTGTIRYTVDDAWFIVKGPNVRDYGYGQYRNHCKTVIGSGEYAGKAFSAGDRYIWDCARGAASTGNLTTWRRVGTSHHLEKVGQDLSNLFGSPVVP